MYKPISLSASSVIQLFSTQSRYVWVLRSHFEFDCAINVYIFAKKNNCPIRYMNNMINRNESAKLCKSIKQCMLIKSVYISTK